MKGTDEKQDMSQKSICQIYSTHTELFNECAKYSQKKPQSIHLFLKS